MNQKIKNFEIELIKLINSSELPPSILYYILDAKTSEIGRLFDEALIEEQQNKQLENSQEPPEIDVQLVTEEGK